MQTSPHTTQIRPLSEVLLGKKYSVGESPDCQTVIEGSDARTEKRDSVGISYTNCVLSTCFARKPRSSCAADDERTSAWEGRSVYHGLSVRRLTRGEAKRAREKQSAAAPSLALGLALGQPRPGLLRRRCLGPFARPERRESLRVRQLVARGFRSRRSRVYGGGGGEGGGGGADASPLEAPSNAISARLIAQ